MNSRGGARYVRRNNRGQFNEVEDVGRSNKQDRGRRAKSTTKSGQGDRGDRKVSGGRSRVSRGRGRSVGGRKGGGRKGAGRK